MQIDVHTTKHADRYQVTLNGVIVTGWRSADSDAGVVICDVADVRGGARFMRTERKTGTVVITPPADLKDA